MSKKILINCGPYEIRAVVLQNDQPFELFYEILDSEKIVGSIFKGRVANVVQGTQSAFIDIGLSKDAFLPLNGVETYTSEDDDLKDIFRSQIQNVLKVDQEVIIQIIKEPVPPKGPRSTMFLSLPGRYLVLTPTIEQMAISRRITSDSERERLRTIGRKILPRGVGVIFRTAAEGLEEKEISNDLRILLKFWNKIEKKIKSAPLRSMIHRDISLPLKMARDFFTDEVEKFIIDSQDEYKHILEFGDFLSPLQRASFELFEGPVPLFEAFGIEEEIQNALKPKVRLPSGGSLVIEKTEALVTIDVNSGRFSGGVGLEETVFKVNLEAAKEIARQIRLRNLAGVIVIDFIDMDDSKHRQIVCKTLRDAFKGDRNRPNILDMSELGLIQMTRRRTSQSLEEILKAPCPCCEGQGVVLSIVTIANKIRNQVIIDAKSFEVDSFTITTHPKIADFFLADDKKHLKEIEKRVNSKIIVNSNPEYNIETIKVEPVIPQDKKSNNPRQS
ncbi:MAG: Rne/Rng family ribonuclease [Candidatus Riflebacteria bacterium]|nr:Rne/Rng family ribonuclease [Candidatus Riflebacteria bacterium]